LVRQRALARSSNPVARATIEDGSGAAITTRALASEKLS
jgi:hypothetical protein